MSIPLSSTDSVFVHKGGKLEKRQFLSKNAPDCTKLRLKFQKFPGGDNPGPPSLWRRTPSPNPSSARRFAPRLAFGHSMVPLRVSYFTPEKMAG